MFLFATLFAQINQDARMLGLNGSYTTLASGFRAVGINPANLAVYPNKSLNICNFSIGLSNNFISIENYNALSGSHLDEPEHENYEDYYAKEKILYEFGGRGLRIRQSFSFPLPALNISTYNLAFTSRITSNFDMGLSDGMVQFLFSGNPYGIDRYLDMEEVLISTQEMGLSYGSSFHGYSAGITLKYLLGLFYMGMESLESPTLTTDAHGFYGKPKYIIRQAIGGSGLGLDVGITTNESNNGYRFGISIINLFGTIKWTQNNFIRDQLEPNFRNKDYYLRPNELMYVNMGIDSVTLQNLEDLENLEDPLVYYETYKVISIYDTSTTTSSKLVVPLEDGTYLYPSGGEYRKDVLLGDGDTTYAIPDDNYLKYLSGGDNSFKTRQPMYIRLGISKRWIDQVVVAVDLVTGFANQLNSSSTWRLSVGAEITRFKNKFLRMGYAFGGVEDKSLSLGYGVRVGSINIDIGLSLIGGFSLNSTKGFGMAAGIIWKLDKIS